MSRRKSATSLSDEMQRMCIERGAAASSTCRRSVRPGSSSYLGIQGGEGGGGGGGAAAARGGQEEEEENQQQQQQKGRHVTLRGEETDDRAASCGASSSRGGAAAHVRCACGGVMYEDALTENVSVYERSPPSVPIPTGVSCRPSVSSVPRTSRARSNDGCKFASAPRSSNEQKYECDEEERSFSVRVWRGVELGAKRVRTANHPNLEVPEHDEVARED